MYTPIQSEGAESSRGSGHGVFVKVGLALGGALLVFTLLSFAQNRDLDGAIAEPINTVGLRASSFKPMYNPSSAAGLRMLESLPGPYPWKQLALAGLQASNRCGDRDMSMRASKVHAVFAEMDNASKAEVKAAESSIIKSMTEMEAGITAPMGFFDPLGISTDASPGKIAFFREVEVKHGRVCMWASIGYLYGEIFHPFYGGNLDGPSYKFVNTPELKTFWLALAFACAIPEFLWTVKSLKPGSGIIGGEYKEDRIPGDYGWDPLNLKDNFDFLEMQNKELNNGRLAMLAVTGMYAQEIATGKTVLEGLTGAAKVTIG